MTRPTPEPEKVDPIYGHSEHFPPLPGPYDYPRSPLELRILELLRQFHPIPLTPMQVSVALGEPVESIRPFLQALAALQMITRPRQNYYLHTPFPQDPPDEQEG